MNDYAVYAFFRKATGRCFYVGQTGNFQTRISQHRSVGKFVDSTDFWGILDQPNAWELSAREAHWIAHFRSLGHQLENVLEPTHARKAKRARYFLLNPPSWHDTDKSLRAASGMTVADVKRLRGSGIQTLDVMDFSYRPVWVADLLNDPNFEPPPDFQI